MSQSMPNFIPIQGICNPYNLELPNHYLPVVKNYTINMSNPLTSHPLEMVNNIYEDYILPSLVNNKNSTIESRLNIYNIIWNTVLNKMDGREISMATKYQASLLSYLKILEANPYHYIKDTTNPHQTNPFDMVVVRSGYPIRFNQNGLAIDLGKENVNLNMRVYRLTNGEYYYPKIPTITELMLNPWRELLYYQYVSKNIVNAFASPHFVIPYGYFMNKNRINFDRINRLRNDETRLVAYKKFILDKYKNILAQSNETSTGTPITITDDFGTIYAGGGIVLINNSGDILLVPNTEGIDVLEDLGGKLYQKDLIKSILNNAIRKSRNTIPFKRDTLKDNFSIEMGDTRLHYKVYVIKTQILPMNVKGSVTFDYMYGNRRNLPKKLHPRMGQILDWLRSNQSIISKIPITTIGSVIVTRDNPRNISYNLDEDFLASDSKISLLVLTESPTHSFYQWCSRKYDTNFAAIRVMERLGIYTDRTWENILFQLAQGLYTMQKFNVYIKDMKLLDNVFIKDIPMLNNQYWVYSIDDVEYFVPNEGYVVMFDLGGKERDDFHSKVSLVDWNDGFDENTIFENFVNIFNPNNFDGNAVSFLTNLPSNKILSLITKIHSEASKTTSKKDISHYIQKYFSNYRHPRLGTVITDQERQFLTDVDKGFKKGELVAYINPSKGLTEQVWALYLGGNDILHFDTKENETSYVTVSKYNNLSRYVSRKEIELPFNRLTDYSLNNLLERYKV